MFIIPFGNFAYLSFWGHKIDRGVIKTLRKRQDTFDHGENQNEKFADRHSFNDEYFGCGCTGAGRLWR
jgi:hypothetical protein